MGIALDDVLQQAYLAAFRGLTSCRAESDATFYTWLEAIAKHELLNLQRGMRAQKRRPIGCRLPGQVATDESSWMNLLEVVAHEIETPSQFAARQEAVTAVRVGVASLPEDQRLAVELRYLAGKSLADTAAELGRSPAAVRGLIWRAQQSLRELLGRSSRWFSRDR
jgi:RNA polymerase sigma factor (sigma-70 family)